MIMEAYDDPTFAEVVDGADLVTPDGVPLVWALRLLGVEGATRVYGPDLMRVLCEMAARESLPIGLYGGTSETLEALRTSIDRDFPGTDITYAFSPPFGREGDDDAEIRKMAEAGVRILFVALGCPKQERWMARHRGKLAGVMVGVGAAFDFLAKTKREAPDFVQNAGLEWAFRLVTEPRRLWRRYAKHNPRFVGLLLKQLTRSGRPAI
jgi:N-acetylglucosaminyldiphosphoundecaprenol N-acetyl-beta-D-mannosaminyltransferase